MEERNLKAADHVFAAGLAVSFLPLFLLICGLCRTAHKAFYFAVFLLLSYAAYALYRCLKNLFPQRKRLLLRAVSLALAAAVFLSAVRAPSAFRVSLALTAAVFLMLANSGSGEYGAYIFTGVSAEVFIVSLALSYSFPETPVYISAVSYGIYCCCFLFKKNRCGINRLLTRRNVKNARIPRRIYSFNTALMFVPFAAAMTVTLLSIPLSGTLSEALKSLLRGIFSVLDSGRENTETLTPEHIAESASDGRIYNTAPNYILKFIIAGAGIALILFLLFFLRRELSELIFRAIRRTGKLFRSKSAAEVRVCGDGYTDSVTYLSEKETPIPDKKGSGVRRWKREYRRYLETENPKERYLKGVALIQQAAAIRGAEILPGETVYDLEKKIYSPLWKQAADGYCRVKYSDYAAGENPEAVDKMLEAYKKSFRGI